ncbi:hypothetical protein ADICYQ_2554 [Cyclobacterium qasimii M12-11B]|uniref:Uncharacterized protein n=1 Tax=Cyclobacterium qasimii M12-11B TaxID=641524 RepID=S7WP14_9BACT|nr:hypothetical protein ADICYQ_2554 [Cyclobacterium qasimii M12-11B]
MTIYLLTFFKIGNGFLLGLDAVIPLNLKSFRRNSIMKKS